VGQEGKAETGQKKHSHAEHSVWTSGRHTCSLVGFGAFSGTEEFLVVQLFHFRVGLNQIVHLSVPSENLNRRGKMDLESLPAIWCRGLTPTGNASEKSKRWI
jgi:hypothetical protein